jgi:hypothetical protein
MTKDYTEIFRGWRGNVVDLCFTPDGFRDDIGQFCRKPPGAGWTMVEWKRGEKRSRWKRIQPPAGISGIEWDRLVNEGVV